MEYGPAGATGSRHRVVYKRLAAPACPHDTFTEIEALSSSSHERSKCQGMNPVTHGCAGIAYCKSIAANATTIQIIKARPINLGLIILYT